MWFIILLFNILCLHDGIYICMKKILLLGASGSIGKQTIDVINNHSDELELVGASVGKQVDYLKELLNKFNLKFVYSIEENKQLERSFPNTKFYYGENVKWKSEFILFLNIIVEKN